MGAPPTATPGSEMPLPARNTLAVLGAGPIGLEAASAALDAGLDVHVFERGEVAAHVIAWGHVSPRPATSSNATTAFKPIPGASANG